MLDYSTLTKSQRSNSYIENYNRKIKLKLSKYLFWKNKCKITWPLFHLFIRGEEADTKKEIYNLENQIPKKFLNRDISNKKGDIIEKNNNLNKLNENNETLFKEKIFRRNWLKFNNFSCRHESFFFFFLFRNISSSKRYY